MCSSDLFRGGKGVACLFGMVIAIQPWIALICVGVFILVVWLTRYVSLGSIAGVVVFCGCVWFAFKETDRYIKWFSILSMIILLWMHRNNIVRLLKGKERKIIDEKKRDDDH